MRERRRVLGNRAIEIVGKNLEQLRSIADALSLGLSTDEMVQLREYFSSIGRNPSEIELQAMGQAWSEHCCYKSSKFYLKKYLSGLKREYVQLAMEDDAGVVDFDQEHVYVLKMESHNHPSAVEPYGGAATGVGGIIRDVLCMGAQPVALLDSLYFGIPDGPANGTLSQRFIMGRVVAGVRDYGNRLGIPNVAGSVYFHSSFNHNPLVNAGCVGIARKDDIVRSKISKVGDILILAGGRTGRDGIHGVNFASRDLDVDRGEDRRSVQLGNPIIEEPLIHAILEIVQERLIDGMKDLGGGGLSSSVGEMCFAGGTGAVIQLDNVLLKDRHMAPWEIWVSESQERMLLAADGKNLKRISEIFNSWDIEFATIGEVVDGSNLKIIYGGETIMDLPLSFLTSGPVYCRNYNVRERNEFTVDYPPEPLDYNIAVKELLSSLQVGSRWPVVRQYDFTVRGSTVVKPFSGTSTEQTHSDAAIIKPLLESERGLSLTSGSNPTICKIDPYAGTLNVLCEAYRNTVATGAEPHSVVDCLNFGDPENPSVMSDFVESLEAISKFCREMSLPVVSGNVSLYNDSGNQPIFPTPTIMMVGIIDSVYHALKSSFKNSSNIIYIIGKDEYNLNGSVYSQLRGAHGNAIPVPDLQELKNIGSLISQGAKMKLIESLHDISEGGLITSLCEMSFGNMVGFDVDLSVMAHGRTSFKLFSELGNRFVAEVRPENQDRFQNLFGGNAKKIGFTGGERAVVRDLSMVVVNMGIEDLKDAWNMALKDVF